MTLLARPAFAAAVLASLGLLVAGCGGGKPGASVASLGATTTGTDTTPSAAGGNATAGGARGPSVGARMVMTGGSVTEMTRFAACMRKNGVPNFPDPNAQGQISISSGAGLDPGSTAFQIGRAHV